MQNRTVTKRELVATIARETETHPNQVRHVVQAFLDKLVEALSKGERMEFRDFGIFEVVRRKKKVGRNPKNAALSIVIPERNAVKFTPSKHMRASVEQSPVD